MTESKFFAQLHLLRKADMDAYLDEAQDKGNLLHLFSAFEKKIHRGFDKELRIDKLPSHQRYLLLNFLSRGGADCVAVSTILGENIKRRLRNIFKDGIAGPVSVFKELVAALLDADIYPEFDLVKNYALPGAAKILLLSPKYNLPEDLDVSRYEKLIPPMGILRIASFLRALGIDADVFTTFDLKEMTGLKAKLAHKNYDVIGLSTLDESFANDLGLLFQIAEDFPKAVYMIGGQGADFDEGERVNIFRNTPIGIIGRGWGEFGLGGALLNLSREPGNSLEAFRKEVGFFVKSDEFPAGKDTGMKTDYSLDDFRAVSLIFDPGVYPEKYPKIEFSSSNYCPKGCIFCSCTNFLRPQPVLRLLPQDVVFMIKKEKEFHKNLKMVYLFDDNFLGNYTTKENTRGDGLEWIRDFSARIKKERLHHINYSLNLTADAVSREALDNLKSMGTTVFQIGIESFSDDVLRGLRKGTGESINRRAIEECFKAGVITSISFMFFTPWETLATLWHTTDTLSKLIIRSVEFQFVVRIFEGMRCQKSAAAKNMKDIDFLTEEIHMLGYGEKFKSLFFPKDTKTKELFKRLVVDKDARAQWVKKENEQENKEKFLTCLNIHALNFKSEINATVDFRNNRITQRLTRTDTFSALISLYNIYSLTLKLIDFTQKPFTSEDKRYFQEKRDILEEYVYHYLFEGALINAITENPATVVSIKKKLKIATYCSILYKLPDIEGFFIDLRSFKKKGFSHIGDVMNRNIRAAELYQTRADLEVLHFLDKAVIYYQNTKRQETADKLSRIRTGLLTPELAAVIRRSLLPIPLLEDLGPAYKQFIDETEELRLRVVGARIY